MHGTYTLSLIDIEAYPADEVLGSEALEDSEVIDYSFQYWAQQLRNLISNELVHKAASKNDRRVTTAMDAAITFAAVYATAESISGGKKKFRFNKHDKPEAAYFEDHCRFEWRMAVFNKDNAYELYEEKAGYFMPLVLTDYLKNGCKSAAPKTEEEFVQWAGTGPFMEESLRESFRLTSDLREACRNLIKACLPFIDSQENKVKAKKLYKTFYNFTALEWEIELPM